MEPAPSLARPPDISLAAQAHRDLVNDPQFPLFPEQRAYATYKWYCSIVHVPPMSFEQWRETTRALGEIWTGKNSL